MDGTEKAICETIPEHLKNIAKGMEAIQVAPVKTGDPMPDFSGAGDIIIPGVPELRIAKLTEESAGDLDVIVKTIMDTFKSEGIAEVMCQLVVDKTTGVIKHVYPFMRDGKFAKLCIKTPDSAKTYGEICKEHEKDLYAPFSSLHDTDKDGGEKEPVEN